MTSSTAWARKAGRVDRAQTSHCGADHRAQLIGEAALVSSSTGACWCSTVVVATVVPIERC